MPVVATCVTQRELKKWDDEMNVGDKPMRQLAMEGHWLLDNLDPDGRALTLALVPPVQRFVLLNFLGCRRAATHVALAAQPGRSTPLVVDPAVRRVPAMRRWHLPRSGEVDTVVDGEPHQVYAVVSDVTRIAEWSHECYSADWLDGAKGPELGGRFQGRNRAARVTWSRVCTITELTPGRRFAYVTGGSLTGDSTRWTFDLEAQEDGTRVRQIFEVLRPLAPGRAVCDRFHPGSRGSARDAARGPLASGRGSRRKTTALWLSSGSRRSHLGRGELEPRGGDPEAPRRSGRKGLRCWPARGVAKSGRTPSRDRSWATKPNASLQVSRTCPHVERPMTAAERAVLPPKVLRSVKG